MNPIERGIDLIGNILNSATVTMLHVETKESFLRVVGTLKLAKQKMLSRAKKQETLEVEQEQEL